MNYRMSLQRLAVVVLGTSALLAGCVPGMMQMMPPGTATPTAYGDGSAGARVVSADENWNNAGEAPSNLQFTDLTINAGVTLTLPSGMTIRCTGSFVNNGSVFVRTGVDGGFAGQTGPGGDFSTVTTEPLAGIGTLPAQRGESGDSSEARLAGRGGFGISEFEARQILVVATAAGGGGAAGGSDSSSGTTSNTGSAGGGGVRILAATGIVNAAGATISADGEGGSGGGGGGGVIILASSGVITNDGGISANGGAGEDGDSNEAPSGGGGGGIISMLAPTVANGGTVDVTGGAAGAIGPGISAVSRFAGGGGGPSGGSGGNGGGVPAEPFATPTSATAGGSGFFLVTLVDPTSLL